MTKRVAVHAVSITIGALYLFLILGAPFCALYHAADPHSGHGTKQHASACSWTHSSCASASLPSGESGMTALHPAAVLFVEAHIVALEFDFQDHPARSPPIFLS